METLSPEERARARKAAAEQAVKLAVSGRWEEAVAFNREFVRRFGDDSEAYNRLGKALTEVGQTDEAREAYGQALELDPTNTIARRNLERLSAMVEAGTASDRSSQIDRSLFIEESGKAAVAALQATDTGTLARLDAGDPAELEVKGNAVNVLTGEGQYLGMVEPRIGLRLAKMMQEGNRYSAAMVTVTDPVRVMIRETYQHPSQMGKVSFPRATSPDVRAYTRRRLVRDEDEPAAATTDDDGDGDSDESWSGDEEDGDDDGIEEVSTSTAAAEEEVDDDDDDSFD